MPRSLQILVRLVGSALLGFAAIHFTIDVARSMQTEKHATSDGFIILHHIEIPHVTFAAAIAGAFLFGLSFIRFEK